KLALLLLAALVAATTETGPAQNSRRDHLSLNSASLPVRLPNPAQAVMDFDGDRLPDRAELTSNGSYKNIHLTLSSPRVTNLHFSTESQQPGSIHAEDIDHDGDNDLIWVSDQQPSQSALWLNSGIGEFARVADTSAYFTEIKRLIADESQSGLFASPVNEQLLATETNRYSPLVRSDDRLPIALHSITLPGFGRNCAAELSPCIARYPKRGPPAKLS
ncbi:MAG TPA: VCBS repeat-containing protein, partial [Blastocatellia bacterium]|nr:VCBS repeat-containing protein [Blastocatellia bacterium]